MVDLQTDGSRHALFKAWRRRLSRVLVLFVLTIALISFHRIVFSFSRDDNLLLAAFELLPTVLDIVTERLRGGGASTLVRLCACSNVGTRR
jgi:Flp pilus assembly protein TadB